jgi:hypothetical protein
MVDKNTENKHKPVRKVNSKAELKDVVNANKVLSQERVSTPGSKESTKTTIQLTNGTIKEVFGEQLNG